MQYRLAFFLIPLLFAQNRLRVGLSISSQGELTGVDTVFRFSGSPLTLWAEARFSAPPEWDTLWIVTRSVGKPPTIHALYRTKAVRSLYRGKLLFRGSGIYFLTVSPPRQTRLLLAGKRIYITDAQAPTAAALRTTTQQKAQATAPSTKVSAPDLSALEVEIPPEALLGGKDASFSISEDLLEDTDELGVDIPDIGIEDEEFELEDIDIGDL